MKPFVARHPLVFSLLLTLVLFGLLSSAPPCLACNLQCGRPSAGGSRTALGVAISPDPRGERPEAVLGNDCIARLLRARAAKLVALGRLQPAFAVAEPASPGFAAARRYLGAPGWRPGSGFGIARRGAVRDTSRHVRRGADLPGARRWSAWRATEMS